MTGSEAYWHCLGRPLERAVLDRNDEVHFLRAVAWGGGLTQGATLSKGKPFAECLAPYQPVPLNVVKGN